MIRDGGSRCRSASSCACAASFLTSRLATPTFSGPSSRSRINGNCGAAMNKSCSDDIQEIVAEVFDTEGQFVFTECNDNDLNYLGEQLAR